MPLWVADYVIVHELAHLFEPRHDRRFHRLVDGYPHRERAQAYLQGYQHAVDAGAEDWLDDLDAG